MAYIFGPFWREKAARNVTNFPLTNKFLMFLSHFIKADSAETDLEKKRLLTGELR